MSARRVTALLMAALGIAAGISGSAHAGYAGANGAITYTQGSTIYSIEAGTRSILVKPDAGSAVYDAVWSPEGHMVAFVKDRFADHEGGQDTFQLQILDARTGDGRTVISGNSFLGRPTWSPDGTELAYPCDRGICVVGLDGTLHRTVPTVSAYVPQVAWSPDGRLGYLALSGSSFRVWVAGADGSNPQPVTPDEASADEEPFGWSPDGTQIAYVDGDRRLDIIGADGRNWRTVDSNALGSAPAWSPNGKSLVYVGHVGTSFDHGLVTINVDGTNRHELTDPTNGAYLYSAQAPDWQRLPALPAIVARPTVSGATRVGQTLTASPGTWSGDEPRTYAYRWQRCSPTCADVTTTSANYVVTKTDAGARLRVIVSASNVAGSASAASAETSPVPEPSFAAVHGRRVGTTVRLTFTACDDSPATLVVYATDWNLVSGHRRNVLRHTWSVGTGPGCHTALRTWRAPHRGSSHVIVVSARDGDGVSTKSLRLTLR